MRQSGGGGGLGGLADQITLDANLFRQSLAAWRASAQADRTRVCWCTHGIFLQMTKQISYRKTSCRPECAAKPVVKEWLHFLAKWFYLIVTVNDLKTKKTKQRNKELVPQVLLITMLDKHSYDESLCFSLSLHSDSTALN